MLGAISTGVDFEKRIAEIYQRCRTLQEIQASFDTLQKEMDSEIAGRLSDTRQKLLENFDEEVHEKLRIRLDESRTVLSKYENWLWQITRYYLNGFAKFKKNSSGEEEHSFVLTRNPFPEEIIHSGPYRVGKNVEDANLYRLGHPLAQRIVKACNTINTPSTELIFNFSDSNVKISILESLHNMTGWLKVVRLTVTTFEAEDYVLLSGITDNGYILHEDQCQRLFSLKAKVGSPLKEVPFSIQDSLNEILKREEALVFDELTERNVNFFSPDTVWGIDHRFVY